MVGTCKLSGRGRPALSLHGAAANDNLAAIEALIAAGAEVNARDEGGLTPLHRAAWPNDNPAIIETLVAAGAAIKALKAAILRFTRVLSDKNVFT